MTAGPAPARRRVAVLLGGISGEREVSLVSGESCAGALREAGHEVIEIDAGRDLAFRLREVAPDVVLNILHGSWGEDGCVQGLLETLALPYSHSGILSSALAMDKTRAKIVLQAAGLPVAEGLLAAPAAIAAAHPMEPPYVVKPNDGGSSLGVVIVREGEPPPALADSPFPELLVERYAAGLELTVAVRDGQPIEVTEIVPPEGGWYDYAAKYAAGGSRHVIPARISEAEREACLEMSARAHVALGCRGVTRADLRYDVGSGRFVLLEVNTQPGMTPTSLVPEQEAHHGLPFVDLVQWMVEDASCNR